MEIHGVNLFVAPGNYIGFVDGWLEGVGTRFNLKHPSCRYGASANRKGN